MLSLRALRALRALRVTALYALYALSALSCASAGDPPGGPEDTAAPLITSVAPDSGALVTAVPDEVVITFDEVVSERTAGQPPEIHGAVLLSPVTGDVRVRWRRDKITIRPRDGFRPGVVYRVEVLPVLTDLRQNRLRAGRTAVFSTGPEIPSATLSGALVDWTGARPVARGLVEAVLMPDSLPYRTLTDSTGYFEMRQMPVGEYLVYGVVDANSDRRLGTREAFDSLRLRLDTATRAELYAFTHDTVAPRLRQIEVVDSVTLRLTFDRPLDPTLVLDTSAVHLAPQEDSTARFGVAGVFTRTELDSLRAREQREARAAADTARADTARADTARADTAAGRRRPPQQAAPARPAVRGARAPLDSTLAQRMLARRRAPEDVRLVRLVSPLPPDSRYYIFIDGVRGLTGVTRDLTFPVRIPAARR